MKKIAFIATLSSSIGLFMIDGAKTMYQNGYEVHLIAGDIDEEFKKQNPWAKCYAIPSLQRGFTRHVLESIRELTKLFKIEKYDLIQYMTPNAAFCAAVAGKRAKIKNRVYIQAGIRYVGFQDFTRHALAKIIEKKICSASTTIRATSQMNLDFAIREKLCKKDKILMPGHGSQLGINIDLIDEVLSENPRSLIREKHNIGKDAFVFMYLGRLNADKGVNELIQAFDRYLKSHQNSYLFLVGPYDKVNSINESLYQKSLQNPHFIYTGNVDERDVYRYLAASDVLTHPTYREGFGQVIGEAMAAYIPVISTNVPGPADIITNEVDGILVEPRNVDALYEAMVRMSGDESLRKSLSEKGRKVIEEKFDRKDIMKLQLEDIENLLK